MKITRALLEVLVRQLVDMIVYFKGTEDILFQLIRGNKGYLYF